MIRAIRGRYMDLALYKAYAELKTEVARYTIGILWWVLDPILYMGVFYVVFSVLPIRGRPEGFVAFLLAGLVAWRWFQKGVTSASESIIKNKRLMQSVYLPKWIFPVSSILADIMRFAIVFSLLLIFLWLSGYPPTDKYLALPLLFVTQLLVIFALGLFLSALLPLMPDVKFLITHGLQMMFFVSGIFFSGRQLAPEHQYYFYMNPMARLLESWRGVLLDNQWPNFTDLLLISAGALLLCWPGMLLLQGLDRRYPKLVADK